MPLLVPAVVANILMLFALLLGLLFEPQATRSTWQIRVAVGALFLLTAGLFVGSIHHDDPPAAAERQPDYRARAVHALDAAQVRLVPLLRLELAAHRKIDL